MAKKLEINEDVFYCIYRYALGRMTGIVWSVCDEIIRLWPDLSENSQVMLKREIEDAFAKDDRDRENGNGHWLLGMDCDRRQWERVRKLWSGGDAP